MNIAPIKFKADQLDFILPTSQLAAVSLPTAATGDARRVPQPEEPLAVM